MPRADIALKLARAAGVPLEYLLDDSLDAPPPKDALTALSTAELKAELGKRMFQNIADRWLSDLKRAEETDWIEVGLLLCDSDPRKDIPANLEIALLPLKLNGLIDDLRQFDPRFPDASGNLSLLSLSNRFDSLRDDRGVWQVVSLILSVWPGKLTGHREHQLMQNGLDSIAYARKTLLKLQAERAELERMAAEVHTDDVETINITKQSAGKRLSTRKLPPKRK